MNEYREGYSVKLDLMVIDPEGKIMSETPSTWYGFDNATADKFSMALINAVGRGIERLSEDKKNRGPK